MKKVLLLILVLTTVTSKIYTQDDKKIRFGIHTTPAVNWMSPNDARKMKNSGAKLKAGIGLVLEFKLTDVVSFQTGLDVTGAGFKAKYDNDTAFYISKEDVITEAEIKGDSINSPRPFLGSGYALMRLKERSYSTTYLNIPLTLKMKTKDINGITYFAQIGGNLFGRLNAISTDMVEKTTLSGNGILTKTDETIEKVDITKTINVFTACGNIGAGLEYNISGSTSLYSSINYQHHFLNMTKADSGYLLRTRSDGAKSYISEFQNGVKLRQIVLNIGVLF
jgi:hypothetical protein